MPPSARACPNGAAALAEVAARLRRLAGCPEQPAAPAAASGELLACARLLEALLPPRLPACEHAQHLQRELLDARMSLGRAHAELRTTRARELDARRSAQEDALTGLPNRAGFQHRLDDALAHVAPGGLPLAVMYLDLDDFKSVNDTLGHDVGDALLRIVGTRLRGALRAGDHVGRLGGDEFACVVGHLPDRAALGQLVSKLVSALGAPIKLGSQILQVQASVGVAVWPQDGLSGDELLRHADCAMYIDKRQRAVHPPPGLRLAR